MVRHAICLLLVILIAASGDSLPSSATLSVCELSKDFGAHRDKLISVRGVYCYGLRETCPQKCANGPWPSFIDLRGAESSGPNREPDPSWAYLDEVQKTVELEAKKGKRFEVWVTAVGRLRTRMRRGPFGACDREGITHLGYGHLGAYPAQLIVEHFTDIQVKENPSSPYDYSDMYHGSL